MPADDSGVQLHAGAGVGGVLGEHPIEVASIHQPRVFVAAERVLVNRKGGVPPERNRAVDSVVTLTLESRPRAEPRQSGLDGGRQGFEPGRLFVVRGFDEERAQPCSSEQSHPRR